MPVNPDASSLEADVAVVGGGIVGLATAYALTARHPDARVVLLEKEDRVAAHQTGRNSGVVHAGVYYKPGSLKATLCRHGVELLRTFCEDHGLPYDAVGKVIVATRDDELPRLDALLERGTQNGVPGLRPIDASELREIEPHAAGLRALHSPSTAIVDYTRISETLADVLRSRGARIELGARVTGVEERPEGVRVRTATRTVHARHLVTCAGLHADRLARMTGADPQVRIVPFRGEYYFLVPERRDLVRGLIYPVANPELPFLGVHLTRTVDGEVEAGPNAVLALAREGYAHHVIRADDLVETLAFAGFWKLAGRFWRVGAFEYYRSFSKAAFVASLRALVPSLTVHDVRRGGAGVRAQAVDRDGRLVDDFAFAESERSLHVLNAPSPAATASLAIGAMIADRVARWFA
jgi:(S)-2-hydroxyglutarate dehydrogenase